MKVREIWNELRTMGKPDVPARDVQVEEPLPESRGGLIYHLIRKRYPPWLYMLLVLGYTLGIFYLIKWFHVGHL